jgi:hypothetical protein
MKARGYPPRLKVVLRKSKYRGALAILQLGRAVYAAMTKYPSYFPTALLTLAQFGADIDALARAESKALNRTQVAYSDRDAALVRVIVDLDFIRAWVQWLADNESDPAAAVVIAEQAGMTTIGRRASVPKGLRLKKSKKRVHGIDAFVTRNAARDTYHWAYSIDGGRTWIDALPTSQARATFGPFTPGMTVAIRYRAVTTAGVGNWSDPVSIIVT